MNNEIFKMWIYKKNEQPKIIDSDKFEEHEKDDWFDSPAKFAKLEDFGISDDDPDKDDKGQAINDAIEGVGDYLNGIINLENMDKDQLEAFAKNHLETDLDKRKSKETLIKQILKLHEDKPEEKVSL